MHELSNHNAPQVGRAFHNLAIAKQPWILAYGICPSKTEKHWAENKNQHPLNTRNLKLFCIFISHFYLSQVRNRWINRWRNRKTDKLMTPKILSGFFPPMTFLKFIVLDIQMLLRQRDRSPQMKPRPWEAEDQGSAHTFLDIKRENHRSMVNIRCLQENGRFLLIGKQVLKALNGNVRKSALWVNLVYKLQMKRSWG